MMQGVTNFVHTIVRNQIIGYRYNDSFIDCFAHQHHLYCRKDRNFALWANDCKRLRLFGSTTI